VHAVTFFKIIIAWCSITVCGSVHNTYRQTTAEKKNEKEELETDPDEKRNGARDCITCQGF